MKRREFFKLGAAAGLPAVGWATVRHVTTERPPLPDSVRVLGSEVTGPDQRLFKGLSDDVFERLRAAFRATWPHRSLRVVTAERHGEAVAEGALNTAWNTSYKLPTAFTADAPPFFPLAHFQWSTAQWIRGTVMAPNCLTYGYDGWKQPSEAVVPVEEMFGDVRVIGMPRLPDGLPWRAHYIDEDTGLVMRALYTLDIYTDEYLARWDVITG